MRMNIVIPVSDDETRTLITCIEPDPPVERPPPPLNIISTTSTSKVDRRRQRRHRWSSPSPGRLANHHDDDNLYSTRTVQYYRYGRPPTLSGRGRTTRTARAEIIFPGRHPIGIAISAHHRGRATLIGCAFNVVPLDPIPIGVGARSFPSREEIHPEPEGKSDIHPPITFKMEP